MCYGYGRETYLNRCKMKKYIILIIAAAMLFISCYGPEEDEIVSDGIQRLVIENAFYHNTLTGCIIEFDFYITEDTCKVGGWAIDYRNGHQGVTNWFMSQTCSPGVRYSIETETRTVAVLPPIISMQGYIWDENDSLITWDAKKTLIPR